MIYTFFYIQYSPPSRTPKQITFVFMFLNIKYEAQDYSDWFLNTNDKKNIFRSMYSIEFIQTSSGGDLFTGRERLIRTRLIRSST